MIFLDLTDYYQNRVLLMLDSVESVTSMEGDGSRVITRSGRTHIVEQSPETVLNAMAEAIARVAGEAQN